jgi:hypothetical protein
VSKDEEGVQLSRKNTFDVNQKVEVYRTLHELNSAFASIVGNCDTLQRTGLFSSKASKLLPSFIQELQAECNQEFLESLHQQELDDWARFGLVREKWEKYLRGPEPKRKEKRIPLPERRRKKKG